MGCASVGYLQPRGADSGNHPKSVGEKPVLDILDVALEVSNQEFRSRLVYGE